MVKSRFILCIICCTLAGKFAQRQTDGFTVSKIAQVFIDEPITPFDERYLEQPFRYVEKGGQSYVFLSEDQQYILKVFRFSKYTNVSILSRIFPLQYFKEKKQKLIKQLKTTLSSYAIAYSELPEETGILGVHLTGHHHLQTPLRIIDKLGIMHTLSSDNYAFVIQKKAIPVKEQVALFAKQGQRENIISCFSNLFSLLKMRMDKGIEDSDPNLAKNFGFYQEKAVQIDGGRFTKEKNPSLMRICNSQEDLQHWINANYPEYSKDFTEIFEEFLHGAL